MNVHANKVDGNQSRAVANDFSEKQLRNKATPQFADNRQETILQRNFNSTIPGQPVSSQNAQPLQRQILGESGFNKCYKLAERHENNIGTLGFTPPTVNSHKIASQQNVIDAFKGKDELIDVVKNGDEDFTARVNQVPQNHVGYIMYLPEAGPWIKEDANKTAVLSYMGEGDNGNNLTNVIRFEISGRGGHEQLSKEVEKHENVHARDNEIIRDAILKPWDLRLTTMKKDNALFNGKTAEEATGKLWLAAGGSLAEKATEASDAWGNASDGFHKHEKGKTRMDHDKSWVNHAQTKALITYYLTI